MMTRLARIQQLMKEREVDLCHATGESHFFYLTGKSISSGSLWIGVEEAILFVDDRYFEMLSNLPYLKIKRLEEERKFLTSFSDATVAMSHDLLSYRAFSEKKELFRKEIIDLDPVLLTRLVKEEKEIEIMKQASDLTKEGIAFVASFLKEGVLEKEIAREFEYFVRSRGASDLSFSPIIAFGSSSSYPHYRAGDRKLQSQDEVTIDVGIKWKGYSSDLTRVFHVGEEAKSAFHAVKEVHDRLAKELKPGMLIQDFHLLARKYLIDRGFADNIRHGIGHFIGIDTHEGYSFAKAKEEVFLEGMVITIEPGLYFKEKFGIRFENMFVVRKDGGEEL